ncbi:MAG: hypothetical protein CVV41_08350 [Candidatus Riflebacteria bacterium HGW-Riflebacteria-1]|jgi:predicted membrane-bound spermidine synthase|nr:MAG: hypothetical protein CVV41_08350 [Candidatus Riflebacteria bacterium HGW-Riflebacteria-1]
MTEGSAARYQLATISAIAGFAANLSQVALFRFFMGQFYGTEIHLGLFLSVWLLGIALGGLIGGKIRIQPATLLKMLVLMPVLLTALIYFAVGLLPNPNGRFISFAPAALFMLFTVTPTAILSGLFIPAMIRLTNRSIGYFYSLEAVGGFIGGVFFSLLIGGKANSIICLLSLAIPALTGVFILARRKALPALLLLAAAPAVSLLAPMAAERIEQAYWLKMHGKTRTLEATVETPYQKLQLSSYWEQKSLFSNGMLADSWPLAESAESRVHTFVSALKSYRRVLVIGAPTPDLVDELVKYDDLRLTIVESDSELVAMFAYPQKHDRIEVINVDPRFYLNQAAEKFDGIMFYAISPVTLAGNRLFTLESFRSAGRMLNPEGVISLQVQGTENYLDATLGRIIITAWRGLQHEFAHCLAVPGGVITFFASNSDQVLPRNAREFSDRLAARQIVTTTFFPMSFYNLLMPHRVKELDDWLKREIDVRLNTDVHPVSFMQQIELWNIYSGTGINAWLQALQQLPLAKLLAGFLAIGFLVMLLPAFLSTGLAVKSVIAGGVAISGATGILSEIILILLYQNRYGAAYQMTALFFGLYMLGLAAGAMLFGRIQLRKTAVYRLKTVKLLQILFVVFCIFFVEQTQLHSAAVIGLMVFTIAFLDGIEFPVSDSILRSAGRKAADSAGLLIFADNTGALVTGALSGLWLLPAIGMRGCFALLCTALALNMAGLLIFAHRLPEENTDR